MSDARESQDPHAPSSAALMQISSPNLRAFLDISPDALVIVSQAGTIVMVNGQTEAIFGYARSELLGQQLELLLPQRFRKIHTTHREHYFAAPHTRPMGVGLQLFGRRKDGTEVPVDISLSPLLLDDTLHVLSAIRDITERRRLEERERAARQEAEARLALLQLILDELPTSVYLVQGEEARLVLANRAATAVWGAAWRVGQPMLDFLATNHIRLFGTDGQPLPSSALATLRAVQQGETVRHQQEIIRHADGTTLPVLVNAVALGRRPLAGPAAQGGSRPTDLAEPMALVVHQDVTALKEAEQLKDHFLGLVAHELRTPLAALKGFVTMLLTQTARGKGVPLTDWQQEALAEIDLATDRLDRLTKDLLDVVRLQAGQLVLHLEPTDLVALCRRVIAQFQQSTDRHRLTLSTSRSHLLAHLDGGRIEQVLANLLTNAIKYSPAGGPVEVTLRAEIERQEALISIRDQGIGIPQKEQAHLFGRFVRASNGQAHGISGTGLGLYLCRELVEQHGGHIWFESIEGEGSTFYIRLPLLQDTSPPSEAERTPSSEGGQRTL
jgi:PAS domain S-box-containing protein